MNTEPTTVRGGFAAIMWRCSFVEAWTLHRKQWVVFWVWRMRSRTGRVWLRPGQWGRNLPKISPPHPPIPTFCVAAWLPLVRKSRHLAPAAALVSRLFPRAACRAGPHRSSWLPPPPGPRRFAGGLRALVLYLRLGHGLCRQLGLPSERLRLAHRCEGEWPECSRRGWSPLIQAKNRSTCRRSLRGWGSQPRRTSPGHAFGPPGLP